MGNHLPSPIALGEGSGVRARPGTVHDCIAPARACRAPPTAPPATGARGLGRAAWAGGLHALDAGADRLDDRLQFSSATGAELPAARSAPGIVDARQLRQGAG